jgi:hypothetical protein
MTRFLIILLLGLPAFGQAGYSGAGVYKASFFASGSTCAAPNFCAYSGMDIVALGTVPDLGGATNNGATVYDTSFLGHLNNDGTTFNSAASLSSITRLTDSVSAYGKTNAQFAAGMGSSGVFTLTNTDTTLVRVDQNGNGFVCRFYPSGVNKGHCAAPPSGWGGVPPVSGLFITTGQKFGGSCSVNCPVVDFGSLSFSLTDPAVLYTFGGDTDITSPHSCHPYQF